MASDKLTEAEAETLSDRLVKAKAVIDTPVDTP